MCIIIDINTIPRVFDKTNKEHSEFEPVYDWIFENIGRLVLGGTTFSEEIKKMPNYVKLFKLLSDSRKVINISDSKVDQEEIKVKNKINNKKCDDPHIIALLKVSNCKILCSNDDRMFPFLKIIFTKNRPKIYYSSRNSNLLCISNVPNCYVN